MLKAVTSALSIAREDWDRLANPQGSEFNPLVSIDFVDLSLPTCLLPQIHNGEGFSW